MRDTKLRKTLENAGILYEYSDGSVQVEPNYILKNLRGDLRLTEAHLEDVEKKLDALMDHLGVEYVHEPARSVVRVVKKPVCDRCGGIHSNGCPTDRIV